MIRRYDSVILDVITRIGVPLMLTFGFYIIMHGHYSPGGGFQGGVILAVSVILHRLTLGSEASYRRFPPRLGLVLAVSGVTAFALTGLLPVLLGGAFLDYAHLPIPGMDAPYRRYWGILVVEVAIGVGVWGALVAIFDRLTGKDPAGEPSEPAREPS